MIVNVKIDRIKANPWQTRIGEPDPEYIKSLAMDIAANGLLQVPVGRICFRITSIPDDRLHVANPNDPNTEIILNAIFAGYEDAGWIELAFGHNRLAAFKWLYDLRDNSNIPGDWSTMPIDIRTLDDKQMALMAWSENEKRKDVSPIERATGYKRLYELGMTYKQIGEACNMASSMIGQNINLLSLPLDIQQLYAQGKLPFDVRLVSRLLQMNKDQAVRISKRAAIGQMTVKRILWLIDRLNMDTAEKYDQQRRSEQAEISRKNSVFSAKAEFGHWNALAQLRLQIGSGLLIEEKLKKAAIEVCQACALYEDASQNVCRDCPAVELIRRLNGTS